MADKSRELFLHTLKDVYFTEQEILKTLPKMAQAAKKGRLKQTTTACSLKDKSGGSSKSYRSSESRAALRRQAMCRRGAGVVLYR
jgi:hypothetical protein